VLHRLLLTTSLLAFTGAIVGCNTVAGAGKDLERGGEAIQNTARDVQKTM
jgi:entericidin B